MDNIIINDLTTVTYNIIDNVQILHSVRAANIYVTDDLKRHSNTILAALCKNSIIIVSPAYLSVSIVYWMRWQSFGVVSPLFTVRRNITHKNWQNRCVISCYSFHKLFGIVQIHFDRIDDFQVGFHAMIDETFRASNGTEINFFWLFYWG